MTDPSGSGLSSPATLFHVSLQNCQQIAELSLGFSRLRSPLDALVRVLMNDDLGKRLERLANRDHLHEHLRAIAVGFDHFFNAGDLSTDLAEAEQQRLLFFGRVRVRVAVHARVYPARRRSPTA